MAALLTVYALMSWALSFLTNVSSFTLIMAPMARVADSFRVILNLLLRSECNRPSKLFWHQVGRDLRLVEAKS